MPHGEAAIEALAASIQHKGLIQNLVVEPETKEDGTPTGYFLVTAGEGRRLAMLLRAKRKQIKKSEPVRCWLDSGWLPPVLRTPKAETEQPAPVEAEDLGSVKQPSEAEAPDTEAEDGEASFAVAAE